MKPTEGAHSWQIVDDDGWITFTDKLIGLEICTHRIGPGDSDVQERDGAVIAHVGDIDTYCQVVPVDHVPSLIRKLVGFAANGSIAIAADAAKEAKS